MCGEGAVRRNRLVKKATKAEVESTVKLWLRYASDRSGARGRNGRTTQSARLPMNVDNDDDDDVEPESDTY